MSAVEQPPTPGANAYREPLPNRRHSIVVKYPFEGRWCYGSVSFFDPVTMQRPAEVFVDAGRPGSGLAAMARDAAVVASLALQHHVPLEALRNAITRNDDGSPAGPLGALLDALAKMDHDAEQHDDGKA